MGSLPRVIRVRGLPTHRLSTVVFPSFNRPRTPHQVNISCGILVILICFVFVLMMRRRRVLLHV